MRILLAALLVCGALSLARAEDGKWIPAGDWAFKNDATPAGACTAMTVAADESGFALSYNRRVEFFHLVMSSPGWRIEAGKSYTLKLVFDNAPPVMLVARGEEAARSVMLLWEAADVGAIARGLSQSQRLDLELGDRKLARFSLKGAKTAADNLLQCHAAATSASQGAPAQGLARWKSVGLWQVDFDDSFPGCLIRTDAGSSEIRFGTVPVKRFSYVVIRDAGMRWIEDGRDYAIDFVADGRTLGTWEMIGTNRPDATRKSLLEKVDDADFRSLMTDLTRAGTLAIRGDGRDIARYSLADLGTALREMDDCNLAHAAAKARR